MSRNYLKLTQDKLDVSTLCQLASAPNCGAISLFVGTTRDSFESKTVVKLEYEAYESMALKALERVCTDIRNKWNDVENIVIYHRLGEVPVQEPSIVIAISSPHRKDAIQATEWCIDTVKKTIPIWKKEVYTESAPEWKENKECQRKKFPKISRDELLHKTKCQPVPENPQDVVVHAPTAGEVDKRINTYIETKKNDIDARNVRNYCIAGRNPDFASCARIDSVLRKNHNSVLVTRVYNPLIRDDVHSECLTKHFIPDGISERFAKLECFLDPLASIPKDLYVRLKRLEDRMLCVESFSPGYKDFWVIPQQSDFEVQIKNSSKRRIATIQEIDRIIERLEKEIAEEKRQKMST